jgi:hypothetical protein
MAPVRSRLVPVLLGASLLIPALPAAAQTQGGAGVRTSLQELQRPPGAPTDAVGVRRELMSVLKLYPPALGRVLKLDPTLFNNEPYLAAYPALVQYLNQHPEIRRDPSFYLENVEGGYYGRYRSEASEMWEMMLTGVFVFISIVAVLASFGWMIRTLIDYRRWHRLSKTQTEAHAKLLDRFTANDELIAYVQSPAGSKYLQSAPITLDAGSKALSAPFGRIIWSIQAGLVLAAAGIGLNYVSGRVTDTDMTEPLFTMGVLALSLGVGFVIAAAASYLLSKRLGLFDTQAPALPGDRASGSGTV